MEITEEALVKRINMFNFTHRMIRELSVESRLNSADSRMAGLSQAVMYVGHHWLAERINASHGF